MYCWGSTAHGELGLGGIEEESISAPTEHTWSHADEISDISCGISHSLMINTKGKVYSCGNNDFGQLGHDHPRKRPHPVTALESYLMIQVSSGEMHSLALNQWGQVFSWGSNALGQLGQNIKADIQSTPKIVKPLTPKHVIQIACGRNHSLVLTNGGELYSWGANNYGQLGIGRVTEHEYVPTLVKSLVGIPVEYISCGGDHCLIVSKSGAVYGWGKNNFGQLGINNQLSQMYPCQVRSLRSVKVRYVDCGDDFSIFLTKDGGVFSCGAGSYGQLGHGNTANEIIPKKITELMGSTVSQICCGRGHTLVFVPSSGQVYGFGLGGAGQLCGRPARNLYTPQVIPGPWRRPNANAGFAVRRLFAGGDRSVVTVGPVPLVPFDLRQRNPDTRIFTFDIERLQQCETLDVNASVNHELWMYLETVFHSCACFNGSFLLSGDEHYGCGSRMSGVDIELAEQAFGIIGRIENLSLRELILQSVAEDLLNQLVSSPPDAEALRVYLTLPLYHEFSNPRHFARLQIPFARAVLQLALIPKRIISTWWTNCSSDYFERLIVIYKNVVLFILQLQHNTDNKVVCCDSNLVTALNMLAHLNTLNHSVEGLKVPYDTFHLAELSQYLDVRIDYVSWLHDSITDNYMCNYPFLFNAETKTQLLQTDQEMQMQTAMNEAASRAFFSMFVPVAPESVSQYLVLNVSRENLVLDTLGQLPELNTADLKKPLKVRFIGEEADDAGGVRKEFFMLLLREIFDPKYGMFKSYEETNMMWFAEDFFEDEVMYLLIGILCGLAIYNFTIIDLPFPLALYKKILEEPVTLSDLRELSPTTANSLQNMLDYEGEDFEATFGMYFEFTRNVFGTLRVISLKPNGVNIPVTLANRREYVSLYVDYIFNKSVETQYSAFSKGFLKVCGGRVLKLFHSHELRAVIVGNQNYDWLELEAGAAYRNGYSPSDQTIRWFWEVFHDLSLDDKKKFLLFLTGTDRIPITGMSSITITIQPTTDDRYLPAAHTCFNLLDLPRYQTKERLQYKLLQAIQQTEGFSLV